MDAADWFADAGVSHAAKQIRTAAARDRLSHAILLTGAGDLWSLARYTAAAHECGADTGTHPCGICTACGKVRRGVHPDVVTVRDETHKNISADLVRDICADIWTRPNEGRRKVYLFPDCGLLTERDQNILLKSAEEGPAYAAFIFCAGPSARVLSTLRSRCTEMKTGPEDTQTDIGQSGDRGPDAEQAMELCHRIAGRRGSVTEWAVSMEKKRLTRDELTRILDWSVNAFSLALLRFYIPDRGNGSTRRTGMDILSNRAAGDILSNRTGMDMWSNRADLSTAVCEMARELSGTLTKTRIVSILDALQKYRRESVWQVGVNHLLGALAAELEGVF